MLIILSLLLQLNVEKYVYKLNESVIIPLTNTFISDRIVWFVLIINDLHQVIFIILTSNESLVQNEATISFFKNFNKPLQLIHLMAYNINESLHSNFFIGDKT